MAHEAGAYPGFHNMKRPGVPLLPPGWDTSPLQGYHLAVSSPVPERGTVREWGSNPDHSNQGRAH